jgi:predicted O-linked N-acetylglucosamine transferase (SPINDLY family)
VSGLFGSAILGYQAGHASRQVGERIKGLAMTKQSRGYARSGKAPTSRSVSLDRTTQAKLQQGFVLHQQGRLSEAEPLYEQVLRNAPTNFDALHMLGVVALQTGRAQHGVKLLTKAINLNSGVAAAHNNLGSGLNELKRNKEALDHFDKALSLKPDYAEAYYNRGSALNELARYQEALDNYDRAVAFKPDFVKAYNNRGNTLRELDRFQDALASYDKAISIDPHYAEAHNNRGSALNELRLFAEALTSCDRAIALNPNNASAYYNRANVLSNLARFEEALRSYEQAVILNPTDFKAHKNRGNALKDLKRLEEALRSYEQAIALKPDYAEAHNNRGNALKELRRFEAALTSYDKAISLKPGFERAYYNRGMLLSELRRPEEAIADFTKAAALKPDLEFLFGNLTHSRMMSCDWTDLESQVDQLVLGLNNAEKVTTPFPLLSITNSPELQLKAAEIFTRDKYPANSILPPIAKGQKQGKIRVGYFSADFRMHAVSILSAELFERHDRARFEVIAFSFGVNKLDEMRKRLEVAFDKFIDVGDLSDREVALLARELKIDIAVDLGGLTTDSRTGIFRIRAAPVQVSFLGYPGTMGMDCIEYLAADRMLISAPAQKHYSEKIVYLPNSYMPNDTNRIISDRRFERSEFGLPQSGFVFCCFNNNYKLNPDVLDRWARILKQVEKSVLWLSESNATAMANLRKETASRGINPERLIFAKRLPEAAEHLARHRLADLFLDTLPYNAHTTAVDALWAGLPIVTLIGETFAGRVGASLLTAVGLQDLITSTPHEYEALAIQLANNPAKLVELKSRLIRNRATEPLFDTQLFTRHIETAYAAMYERYHADLSPEHIYVRQ